MTENDLLRLDRDLETPDAFSHRELFEAIELSRSPAERLAEVLEDGETEKVRRAIVRFGGEAFDQMLNDLRAGSTSARKGLLRLLRELGVHAIPELVEKLGSPSSRLRHQCVDALGKLGPAILPQVTAALDDADANRRLGAALALGELGAEAAPAADRLIGILEDPDAEEELLYAVIWTLGQIGPDASEALVGLVEILRQGSDFGRILAAEALGRLGDRAALFALFIAYESEDEELRQTAEDAMETICAR